MPEIFTTHEVAELYGVQSWQVRRLFEDGTLPDPPRFGRNRAIPRAMLPAICAKLQDRGWVKLDACPVEPIA